MRLASLAPLLAIAGIGLPTLEPEPDGSIKPVRPAPVGEVVITRSTPQYTTRQQRRAAERRARKQRR